MAAMFANGLAKMSNLYRELSNDAEYPVSIHLKKWFKKRRFTCEKLTDDGRQTIDVK